MRTTLLTTVSLIAFSTSAAHATSWFDVDGYIQANIGVNALTDADNVGAGSTLSVESETEAGASGSVALGARYRNGLRGELEFSYRTNDADSLTITNPGAIAGLTANASGDVSSYAVMGNAYYDFEAIGESAFGLTPYVMAGVGLTSIDADINTTGGRLVSDDDMSFAYQFGLGLGYGITDSSFFDVGYRYFRSGDPTFTDASGASFESEYQNHAVQVGLRIGF